MNVIEKQYKLEPNRRVTQLVTIFILCLLFVWSLSAIELEQLTTNGFTIAKNILVGMVQPDLSLLVNVTTSGVPYLLIETMAIAFLGTVVGSILAIPLAFFIRF